MSEWGDMAGNGIPSLVALLIAALALRRGAADSDRAARQAGDLEVRQELSARKLDGVAQATQITALTKQVADLTTLLDEANMKLLRELLKKNGSTNVGKE